MLSWSCESKTEVILSAAKDPVNCKLDVRPGFDGVLRCAQNDRDSESIPFISPATSARRLGKVARVLSDARMSSTHLRHFASDNYAGIDARSLGRAGGGPPRSCAGYGDDQWTAERRT